MKTTITLLMVWPLAAAFAADAPKAAEEKPPVLTAEDREPLHELNERLLAAKASVPELEKAMQDAFRTVSAKCGDFGVVQGADKRMQCGSKKAAPPASPTPPASPSPARNK